MPHSYAGSDRHKRPWVRGETGSQCRDADGPTLFRTAVVHPHSARQRFATDGQRWFRALPDDNPEEDGGTVWHGHPVPPVAVPVAVQKEFVRRGVLRRVSLSKVLP